MEFNIRSAKRRRRRDSLSNGVVVLPPQRLVQNKLIIRTLDESIGKFKVSIKLPVIFRNPLTVLQSVRGTKYEACVHSLMEYLKTIDKSQKFDAYGPYYNDVKLIALIEMFQNNYKILNYLPNWGKEECVADHTVLEAFDLLEEIVDHRILRSAELELKREREVHTLYFRNRNLRKEIDALRRNVRVLKRQKRWKRIIPTPEVVQAQHEVRKKDEQRLRLVNETTNESARRIKNLNYEYESKYNALANELAEAKKQFFQLKNDHTRELTRARDEKNKFVIQLKSITDKHDRVLAEKFKENLYLEEELRKQTEAMEIFMKEFKTVEDVYLDLHQRQERISQAKSDRFFSNRAARIIQRHWRRYAENLREERSKLHGKKKKKDSNNVKENKARSTKK